MAITLAEAELIGVSLQSVCFGIYLVLFAATVYVFATRKRLQRKKANKIMLTGALLLFLIIVVHWILDQSRLYAAFIQKADVSDGANFFYGTLSEKRDVARNFLLVFEIIIADTLLIYRLYIIWNRNWQICVLPILTLLGTVVSALTYCSIFIGEPAGVDLWTLSVSKWVVAAFSLTLATNLLAVAFIAGRIIYRNHKFKNLGGGNLNLVLTVTIESAAVYCLFNFLTMVTLASKSALDFTFRDIASPVTGISFCLITLRVGLSKAAGWKTDTVASSSLSTAGDIPNVNARRGQVGSHAISVQVPMHVVIKREQETDADDVAPAHDEDAESGAGLDLKVDRASSEARVGPERWV